MDAAAGFGLWDPLNTVSAHLIPQVAVDLVAHDRENDFLEAPEIGATSVDDLDLPALLLGKTAVHAEEVSCEEGGLIPAGAGADLNDDVSSSILVFNQDAVHELLLGKLELRGELFNLLERQLPQLRFFLGVFGDLPIVGYGFKQLPVPLVLVDHLGERAAFARQQAQPRWFGEELRVCELLLNLCEALLGFLQLLFNRGGKHGSSVSRRTTALMALLRRPAFKQGGLPATDQGRS